MKLGKTNIFNQSGRSNESPTNANYRGVGLSEMIYSIENNLEHRCNGELVLHVLDMLDSTIKSAKEKNTISLITSRKNTKIFTEKEISLITN